MTEPADTPMNPHGINAEPSQMALAEERTLFTIELPNWEKKRRYVKKDLAGSTALRRWHFPLNDGQCAPH